MKIRGFRVELDAVSTVLESVPGCIRAVTLKLDDTHLVAFVAPATVDPEVARAAVADALPYYCVPVAVHALAELPLTSRGKVDKALLLELGRARRAGEDPGSDVSLSADPPQVQLLQVQPLQVQPLQAQGLQGQGLPA